MSLTSMNVTLFSVSGRVVVATAIVGTTGAADIGCIPDIDPRTFAPCVAGRLRSIGRMDAFGLAPPSALLEREHEVERIGAALRAAGQQAGGALVIEGAAGMGKSRLLNEVRVQASKFGIRVLSARATELEQGFPFGVMRQLFERPLLEADTDERKRWLGGRGGAGCRRAHFSARDGLDRAADRSNGRRSRLRLATRPVLVRLERRRRFAGRPGGRRSAVVRCAVGPSTGVHHAPARRPAAGGRCGNPAARPRTGA